MVKKIIKHLDKILAVMLLIVLATLARTALSTTTSLVNKQKEREAYEAWCKDTGNPKSLTLKDYRAVRRIAGGFDEP